jgi:hypothetical protein
MSTHPGDRPAGLGTASRSRSRSPSRSAQPRPSPTRPLSWGGRKFPLSPEPPDDDDGKVFEHSSQGSSESHHSVEKDEAIAATSDGSTAPKKAGDAEQDLEKTDTHDTTGPGGALHPDSYPDGGAQAWMAVLGAFCCLFVSFGWINGT